MANETVTLLRSAKLPGVGWRRGQAIIGKTGRIKPDFMFVGRGRKKKEVHAPEGHYVLRHFDGRLPRYKKLGNDPSEALDELQRAKSELKYKNAAKTAGYIIPTPAPVKRKSLAEYGREFLEQKRSPSLKLDKGHNQTLHGHRRRVCPAFGQDVSRRHHRSRCHPLLRRVGQAVL